MGFYDLKCFPGFSRLAPARVSLQEGFREPRTNHIRSDNAVSFSRRVETAKRFVFLTNNFSVAPLTVASLYRSRWRIELFFKWIKQHLRIKRFFGTSANSVKTQIWIGVSVYVLIAIIKKKLGLKHSLYTILQILSLSLFEKTPILSLFADYDEHVQTTDSPNQLNLWEI